jgi:hypothetical protein
MFGREYEKGMTSGLDGRNEPFSWKKAENINEDIVG